MYTCLYEANSCIKKGWKYSQMTNNIYLLEGLVSSHAWFIN